jgi:hypothetical protein
MTLLLKIETLVEELILLSRLARHYIDERMVRERQAPHLYGPRGTEIRPTADPTLPKFVLPDPEPKPGPFSPTIQSAGELIQKMELLLAQMREPSSKPPEPEQSRRDRYDPAIQTGNEPGSVVVKGSE